MVWAAAKLVVKGPWKEPCRSATWVECHRDKEPAGKASLPNVPFHRKVTSHFASVLDRSDGIVVNKMEESLKKSRKACLIKYRMIHP